MHVDEIPDTPVDESFTAEEQAYIDSQGTSDQPKVPDKPAETAEKPAEAAKDAPADGDKVEGEGPDKVTYVRQEALHEERERRKKVERERQAEREELARLRGQLDALNNPNGPLGKPKPADGAAPTEKPDPEKDPIGYIKWRDAQDAKREADERQAREESDRQVRISNIGKRHADEFAKTQADFHDTTGADGKTVQGAYSYLREKSFEELRGRFPEEPDEKIWVAVNLAELTHTQQCVMSGRNAAGALYEEAVRQGYKPPKKEEPKPSGPTEAERIAALEKAQKGAASLGGMAAGSGDGALTMEALADMSEEEFAAATKGKKWDKLASSGVLGR